MTLSWKKRLPTLATKDHMRQKEKKPKHSDAFTFRTMQTHHRKGAELMQGESSSMSPQGAAGGGTAAELGTSWAIQLHSPQLIHMKALQSLR